VKKILFTLLSILSIHTIYAQNQKDSLLKLLKKHPQQDTIRCNLLNALIEAEGDDAIWPKYNDELTTISNINLIKYKNNAVLQQYYLKTKCLALNNEGYKNIQIGNIKEALNNIKTGILIAKKNKLLNELSLLYNNLADYYLNVDSLDLMQNYTEKAFEIAVNTKNFESQVSLLGNLAFCYKLKNNTPKFIELTNKSIALSKTINKNELAASALYSLGEHYSTVNNVKEAAECFISALKYAEKDNDKITMAFCNDALGSLYKQIADYDKAEYYSLKALDLGKQINDKKRIAHQLVSIGLVKYEKLVKFKSQKVILNYDSLEKNIKELYQNSIQIYNQIDFESGKSYAYTKFADFLYYLSRKKVNNEISINDSIHNKAAYYYTEALKIDEELENYQFIAEDLNGLANISLDKKNYNQALNYGLSSLEASKKSNLPKNILNSARCLTKVYKALNKPKEALQMLEMYSRMNDTIYTIENKTQIIKAEYKYETEKKEAAIKELEQQNQITTLQSKQKSIILYSVIALVIAITLLSYFLFTRYKTKKQNELLKTKLEDAELLLIEKQKASESEIKAIKSQMNPHFFYNALNSIQGYIYSGDKENAAKSLGLFSDLSRSVLESSRNTEISLHDEVELLENYLKLETMRLPKIKYTIQTSENINLHDVHIPAMILQPLVENAIKHGLANKQGDGTLNVTIQENNNKLIIDIEDDGIGRDAAAEIGKRMIKKSASFSTEANISRIELLNANKTEKITQNIVDKKDNNGNATGTIVKLVIPIELYD